MNVPSTSLPDPDPGQVPANELPVIEVKNLVKEYRLGAMEGLRSMARRLLGRSANAPRQQFRALDDVSFSVKRGEVVGIIGHNGAGKSTLLKHLCRITAPTSGSVTVRGRVAPLIEVGAGLVGEMTGRENIYLNASILGLTREEIESKVDEIIAFAELERFIDTPIKRYSSGMQGRLGYAIATAADADVLIVDEVLAVGDLQFQRKSIERMQRLIGCGERTILIVGHKLRQLERICSRLIVLERGSIIDDGNPAQVVSRFYERTQGAEIAKRNLLTAQSASQGWIVESSGAIDVTSVSLVDVLEGQRKQSFLFGQPFDVEIEIASRIDVARADVGVAIQTLDHLPVAISDLTSASVDEICIPVGISRLRCRILMPNIMPGVFSLRIGVKDSWGHLLWGGDSICPFEIKARPDENRARYSDFAFIKLASRWEVVA